MGSMIESGASFGTAFFQNEDPTNPNTASGIETAALKRNISQLDKANASEFIQKAKALQDGSRIAGEARSRGSATAGAAANQFAAAGIDVNSGTAQVVQDTSLIYSDLDAQAAMNNARAQAFGHDQAVAQNLETADFLRSKYAADQTARRTDTLMKGLSFVTSIFDTATKAG